MIQLLPEEERDEEFIAIYTDFALSLGADHESTYTGPDRIHWNNETWRVVPDVPAVPIRATSFVEVTSILSGYTDLGILASGLWRGADTGPLHAGDTVVNSFALWADSYDDQPDADWAAHKAVLVQVGLVLAGSIVSIVITVNVMI